jgi:hypothetical protein
MIGVVKMAAIGAVMSYGAAAVVDWPTHRPVPTVLATGSIDPAPQASGRTVRKPVRIASTTGEPSPCKAVRRKFWVEGEGWVVRARC